MFWDVLPYYTCSPDHSLISEVIMLLKFAIVLQQINNYETELC